MAKFLTAIFFAALLSCHFNVYAQSGNSTQSARDVKQDIKYYKDSNTINEIPLLKNRFRIDAQIDEIMLLFYRHHGSPPIILVRPDGSKLKVEKIPEGKVSWYDDRNFDLIKIKKPMPGPWQAIGNILPNSQIMVVSDVRIEVEPLPPVLLQGETLKVTGQLFNGDKVIDDPLFQNVANLDVDFYSSNNSAYDNFGAKPVQLTSFRDDGRVLDEYANDAIFTGEFTLTFAPGEWLPVYFIKMPMASRELKQKAVVVQKNPISFDVRLADEEGEKHQLIIKIDDSFVDPDSVLFQGTITYPDKQEEPFSISEGEGLTRKYMIENTEPGVYRVNVSAFGITTHEREFMLVVPEYTFNVAMPEAMLEDMLAVEESEQPMLEGMDDAGAPPMQAPVEEEPDSMLFIIILNASLLLVFGIGLAVFLFIKKRKAKASS